MLCLLKVPNQLVTLTPGVTNLCLVLLRQRHSVASLQSQLADLRCVLQAYDADGGCYGTFKVPFSCDGSCGDYTSASATKIGDC